KRCLTMAMEYLKIGLGIEPKGFKVIKQYSDSYNRKATVGDLFIAERGAKIYHAGVYCSEEEIIHFTPCSTDSVGSLNAACSFSSDCKGIISKVSVKTFSQGKKFAVFRKIGEIPCSFKEDVFEAMQTTPLYDVVKNNCVHFALGLLKITLQ
ncbi:uncharacterized protein DAT39_007931, partial [Clarias magur]